MSDEERERKLGFIARLCPGGLIGWHRECKHGRGFFEGELEALHKRARELGVTL